MKGEGMNEKTFEIIKDGITKTNKVDIERVISNCLGWYEMMGLKRFSYIFVTNNIIEALQITYLLENIPRFEYILSRTMRNHNLHNGNLKVYETGTDFHKVLDEYETDLDKAMETMVFINEILYRFDFLEEVSKEIEFYAPFDDAIVFSLNPTAIAKSENELTFTYEKGPDITLKRIAPIECIKH